MVFDPHQVFSNEYASDASFLVAEKKTVSTVVKRQRDSRASVPVPGQPTRWRCSSIAKDLRRVLGVTGQRGVLTRAGKRPEGAIVFFVVLFLPRASPVSQ